MNTLLYKIYLSHLIRKGWYFLCVRGELKTETDCFILTPSSSDHSSTSSHSDGLLNRGSWGPKPSVWSWFSLRHLISNWNCNSNSNWPKPSVAHGYIIVWRSPASCGRTQLHRIQPRPQVKVIFRHPWPGAPVSALPLIYTGASLDWRLGRGPICNTVCKIKQSLASSWISHDVIVAQSPKHNG